MKKIQKIADNDFSSKLNDLLKEYVPAHRIDKIKLADEECENGHWEVRDYTRNGKVSRQLVWVCD